ncbi:MAG: hypothetical protein ACOWWM_06125 [Desulfobacterales bacterium]
MKMLNRMPLEACERLRVNCRHCRHYHVTWDPRWPHGCRAMGFKSHMLPHQTVLKSTPGIECLLFQPRNPADPR